MAPTGRSKNSSRPSSSRLLRFRARLWRRTVASEVLNSSARSMFVLRSRSGSASLAMIASSSGLTGLQSERLLGMLRTVYPRPRPFPQILAHIDT
nr:MAG TPA: hypothetical protein [Caudoviricetes sp.]